MVVAWCCFNTKPVAPRAWADRTRPERHVLGGLGKMESVGPLRLSVEADEGARRSSCPRAGTGGKRQTARPALFRLVGEFGLVRPGGTMGSAPPGQGEKEKEAEARL